MTFVLHFLRTATSAPVRKLESGSSRTAPLSPVGETTMIMMCRTEDTFVLDLKRPGGAYLDSLFTDHELLLLLEHVSDFD
jgi:hypothetical protein